MKCTIVPVIIGATGTATKGLRENLEAITKKTFNIFTTKGKLNLQHHT
jgi:hypothetical protein